MKVQALELNTVHVHHLGLALDDQAPTVATALLSDEERLTAAYFRHARHRDRFIAGRGLVKQLLASYTNTAPDALEFRWNAKGKPALTSADGQRELFFNYSHSADHAICAVTHIGPIGADVEQVQAWDDLRELERLVFTTEEIKLLEELATSERDLQFFRLWTHKEALVKATGEGLSLAPESFGVDLEQAKLMPGRSESCEWRFTDVSTSPQWPAAIAVASEDYTVLQFS